MVRPDAERNYYRDLGIDETADITEIKKKYKKLALKFHPDRNQSNVEEATKEFQTIGEAHEVLSDPAAKQKYDIARAKKMQTERLRFGQASGVRGNPWQNAADQYPMPPKRRDMPPRGSRTAHPTAQPTTSQRYENYMFGGRGGRGGNSSKRTEDDAEDSYSAFDTYKKYKETRKGASTGGARTGPSQQQSRPMPATPPRAAAQPRTAAQREKADAAFGSRRGKAGFQPGSPASTDEPQVSRSSYFSTGRHTNLFANATDNLRRERDETAEKDRSADSMEDDSDGDGFANRTRRQYASQSGEKLDPREAAPDLGRTRSTRKPKNSSPTTRQRSMSVPNVEETPGFTQASKAQADITTSSNPSNSNTGLHNHFPHTTSSATAPGTAAPSTTSASTTTPNRSAAGSKTSLNTGPGPAPTNGQVPIAQNGNPSVLETLSNKLWSGNWKIPTTPPVHQYSANTLSPLEERQNVLLKHIIDQREKDCAKAGAQAVPAQDEPTFQGNDSERTRTTSQQAAHAMQAPVFANTDGASRFSFNLDEDTFNSTSSPKHPFASNSAENVTHYSSAFNRGEDGYNFSANTNLRTGAAKHRSTSGSRMGQHSPLKKSRSGPESESIGRVYVSQEKCDPVPTTNTTKPPSSRFNPSEWSKKFNSEIFTPPPAPAPSTSPTRGRSGTTKKGKKATVIDEQTGVQDVPSAEPSGGGSPMAMDIDSPPLGEKNAQASTAAARNIFVEPSRPDWRSRVGTSQGVNGHGHSNVTGMPSKPAAPMSGSKANPISIGGSEDTNDLKASFADLRKTEPLRQPRPTGLGEWSDIKTTLPFQSAASTNIHVDRPLLVQTKIPDMTVPRPPVAPTSNPNPSSNGAEGSWIGYMASFGSYLEEWTRFDRRVTNYLVSAQRELDERQITGRGYGWLDPGRDDGAIKTYEIVCRDVQDVREQWVSAGRIHREAVREMRLLRERMRLAV